MIKESFSGVDKGCSEKIRPFYATLS